jgi:RAT1-interacting protein
MKKGFSRRIKLFGRRIYHLCTCPPKLKEPFSHYRIASLPSPPWNPLHSLHFLHGVLSLVLSNVLPSDPTPQEGLRSGEELPPARVWRFSFIPRRGCELWYVGEIGTEDGRWGGVMKEEYVRWRMSRP